MIYQLREPVLHATPLIELRPTQMTLGMREVVMKQASWKERDPKDLEKFLGSHMVPVIVGPGQQKYLIDHHHLARALHEIGVKSVFVTIVTDLHKLDVATFWNMMDYHGWTHPFDAKGRRCDYAELPATIEDMHDDPYRSLAGELRRIGGFAKELDPLFGIRLGRFSEAAHQAESREAGLFRHARRRAGYGEIGRGQLSAGVVRSARKGRGDGEAGRRGGGQSQEDETRKGR